MSFFIIILYNYLQYKNKSSTLMSSRCVWKKIYDKSTTDEYYKIYVKIEFHIINL